MCEQSKSRRARVLWAALAVALVLTAGVVGWRLGTGGADGAACAAPQTSVKPDTVHPGDQVTVSTTFETCDDYGTSILGLQFRPEPPALPTEISVIWDDGKRSRVIGGVRNPAYGAPSSVTVAVPADAPAGEASMEFEDWSAPAAITVAED